MHDIDSNQSANTRMDQDNEKNIATRTPSGNDSKVSNGQDIDEASRDKLPNNGTSAMRSSTCASKAIKKVIRELISKAPACRSGTTVIRSPI